MVGRSEDRKVWEGRQERKQEEEGREKRRENEQLGEKEAKTKRWIGPSLLYPRMDGIAVQDCRITFLPLVLPYSCPPRCISSSPLPLVVRPSCHGHTHLSFVFDSSVHAILLRGRINPESYLDPWVG